VNVSEAVLSAPRTAPLKSDPHVWRSTMDAAERVFRYHLAKLEARAAHIDVQSEHWAGQDASASAQASSADSIN